MDNTPYAKQPTPKQQMIERPKNSMDIRSENMLVAIFRKRIEELTEPEKAFLRARRDYLKPSQLSDYKIILNQTAKATVKKKNAKK